MRTDKRRIQTAVLGGADSDEPLMLPMEAIELDAFRRRHEGDTFWCGTLLGGCGGQLTTKLYSDRACHFAHHADPDGLPHICGRHARGVNSADHLYVKSAAVAWLRARGEGADFDFAQPGGAPIGSVVDIRFQRAALRVHLDGEVVPEWDEEGHEPVLGVSVPVDQDTLIRRWYVHRIRLDSQGTTRQVQIGTEAFARPTEWFGLDECEVTQRGLSTPAVERIVASRSAPPPRWSPGKVRKAVSPDARAWALLSRLNDACKFTWESTASRVCWEIARLDGVSQHVREQLDAAVDESRRWLEEKAEERRELFSQLDQAVSAQNTAQVRKLLTSIDTAAVDDRTKDEHVVADRAAEHLAAAARATQERIVARSATERAASAASSRVGSILNNLRRGKYEDLGSEIEALDHFAEIAGNRLTIHHVRQIKQWKQKHRSGSKGLEGQPHGGDSARQQGVTSSPAHRQVPRRHWIKRDCPNCRSAAGKECLDNDGQGRWSWRPFPHDERIQLTIEERQARVTQGLRTNGEATTDEHPTQGRRRGKRKTRTNREATPAPSASWQVTDIACHECGAAAGKRCKTPSGHPHQTRVRQFRRRFPSA
ncbi:zinc finger domain-containing protein [Streptomyces sp. NPDC002559]